MVHLRSGDLHWCGVRTSNPGVFRGAGVQFSLLSDFFHRFGGDKLGVNDAVAGALLGWIRKYLEHPLLVFLLVVLALQRAHRFHAVAPSYMDLGADPLLRVAAGAS